MEEKVLTSINFDTLVNELKKTVFKNHLNIFDLIIDDLYTLSYNNFTCYKANMSIIKCRKLPTIDYKEISYFENMARTVGESRVNCKSKINKIIHNHYNSGNNVTTPKNWMSDDIVYSVGEMLDRISIEFIKQNHFMKNEDDNHKIEISKTWEERVKKYLRQKLDEIKKKGYYDIIDETRTYKV